MPPLRVMMGVPLLVLLIPILAYRVAVRRVSMAANVLAALFVLRSVTLLSGYSANADLIARTDTFLAGAIYTDMVEARGRRRRRAPRPAPCPVRHVRARKCHAAFPLAELPLYRNVLVRPGRREPGSPAAFHAGHGISSCSRATGRAAAQLTVLVQNADMAPPGSTRQVGNVTLVKLGEEIGWSTSQILSI